MEANSGCQNIEQVYDVQQEGDNSEVWGDSLPSRTTDRDCMVKKDLIY